MTSLVIFKFISSFVERERSAYREIAVEYSSETLLLRVIVRKLIGKFLDKYLVFSNKYLV